MKKIIVIILAIDIAVLMLVALFGVYKFNYLASLPGYDVDGTGVVVAEQATGPQNATYIIESKPVTLVDGVAEIETSPDAVAMQMIRYFGNEVATDVNNDGREDSVFLITQNNGGSGTFFYVVAALNTVDGWIGSHGYLLGDRIAPQTTELSQNPMHQDVIVVNYMDRAMGQAMTQQPSVGESVWLKLDTDSMQFGEVMQNFAGEADPSVMTLDMKSWTWQQTMYNNDTTVVPEETEAFVITFKDDDTFSAITDCNILSGTYDADERAMTFGQIASTRAFCEDSQEQVFTKMLGQVQSYFFTSRGELVFELQFDTGSSVFR